MKQKGNEGEKVPKRKEQKQMKKRKTHETAP